MQEQEDGVLDSARLLVEIMRETNETRDLNYVASSMYRIAYYWFCQRQVQSCMW
jgi:hypothetical protein